MATEVENLVAALEDNICRVVLGKREVVRLSVVALLAGEHILIEDVPGVGKTLVAKAMARSVHGRFCRIQFTPDLLPSDIIGTSVYDTKSSEFIYKQGPLFANIVLADEINRTTPRTQSALLEAMSEGEVTVDGTTYTLPKPFMVIATQNPFEFEGTYPLLESQLDRFLLRTSIGYPSRDDELNVFRSHRRGDPVDDLAPALDHTQVIELQEAVREVTVDDAIHDYLLDLVEATRRSDDLLVGVSTRGGLCWYRASQALAFVEGRRYVIPDDIKRLAVAVVAHRVISKGYHHTGNGSAVEAIVGRIVDSVPVPE